ncbi:hypothetical protein DIPPA_63943, partial [Diplonema papillatum]
MILAPLVALAGMTLALHIIDRSSLVPVDCTDTCFLSCDTANVCDGLTVRCHETLPCYTECSVADGCVGLTVIGHATGFPPVFRCVADGCPAVLPDPAYCYGPGCASSAGGYDESPGPYVDSCDYEVLDNSDAGLTITGDFCKPGHFLASGYACKVAQSNGK